MKKLNCVIYVYNDIILFIFCIQKNAMKKNKTNILLENLDAISNFKGYSKINSEYDKVLGNHALKTFVKSLGNQTKKVHKTFLEEMATKYPYKEEQSFSNIQSLNKENLNTKQFFNKLINNSTQTENSPKRFKLKRTMIIFDSKKPEKIDLTPNPCTYHPKYDCIFRRIQVAKITPEKNVNFNNNNFSIKRKKLKKIISSKYNNFLINKYKKEKKKLDTLLLYNKNSNSFSDNNSINKNKKESKSKTKKESNIIKDFGLTNRKEKNNKSQKKINLSELFKKINKNITPPNHLNNFNRKKRNIKNLFNENDINNCNEDYKKDKKNIIDFKKMSKRDLDIIINKSALKYPSFYKYEPKYDYITQSLKGFNFGENANKTKYEKKKFLLKKMWCSYADISKDYYLINNFKLSGS